MISSAYIASSETFSINECLAELTVLANELGTSNLTEKGRIFDGKSTLFINAITETDTGYDLDDLKRIEILLQKKPVTFLQIEYNEGESASRILIKAIKKINSRWNIVFDNCFNHIYNKEEIENLTENGEF